MKSGMALASGQSSADQLVMDKRSAENSLGDMRNPRPEPASVYELEVLICRLGEGRTRGRAANLPLPDSYGGTVREVLQLVVAAARTMINERLATDEDIPWIDPPALPEEPESRFVVPLVMDLE